MKVNIRFMLIKKDLPEILTIENACYEDPWTKDEFIRVWKNTSCMGYVALNKTGSIVGYMIYELCPTHLQLLNLTVMSIYHREHVGRQLVQMMISKLTYQRRKQITVYVKESNLAAQLFFKSLGFKAISILTENSEDFYLFEYKLPLVVETWEDSDIINKVV